MDSKVKYAAVATAVLALIAIGVIVLYTFRQADESAMRSCLSSIQLPIVDSLGRDDSGIMLHPDWRTLSHAELGQLLERARKSGGIDCSSTEGIDAGRDSWGSPIEVSARQLPHMKIEVKIQSMGRDTQRNTSDDIVLESR